MSRVLDDMDNGLSASQAAEAWFARLMAPDCTEAERQAFERWRQRAPAHAQAYAATAGLWERLEGLEDDEVIGPYAEAVLQPEPLGAWADAMSRRGPRPAPQPRHGRWRLPAAAAAGLLAMLGGWQWLAALWNQADPQYYQTGAAFESVVLDDGSQVRMDLSTRLEVRLARNRREVRLLDGRAIFQVAHDRKRPFVVEAGPGRITALGTRFQVDRLNGGLAVTLVEGSVAVSKPGDRPDAGLRLRPGQQARYSRSGAWTRQDADPAAATSWSQGFHVFSGTPLGDAVREINRYAARPLRLADPSLEALVISGNFKIGDADTIATAMPAVLPVRVAANREEIVLTRR